MLQRTLESLIQEWDDFNLIGTMAGSVLHCDESAADVCEECNRRASKFHLIIKETMEDVDISEIDMHVLLRIDEIYKLSLELDKPLEF